MEGTSGGDRGGRHPDGSGGSHPRARAGSAAAGDLIEDGTLDLSFRYRLEHVDSDDFDRDADASTLRSRITLTSGSWKGLGGLLELEDVREVLVTDFDAGGGNTPDRTRYPVVADVEGTEINQAWLGLETDAGIRVRVGRQRINLDNQRFVGGVGWRQEQQTFDALEGHPGWRAARCSMRRSTTSTGSSATMSRRAIAEQGPSHLLEAELALGTRRSPARLASRARQRGCARFLDPDDTGLRPARRAQGADRWAAGAGPRLFVWRARQVDHADNPADLDARYWHLVGRIGWGDRLELRLGRELLSGDADRPGRAFRTPLATLHAFNGWADRFLATPDDGLDDRYLALAWRPGSWVGELRAHRFTAEDGSADHGRELDLHLGRSLGERFRADLFAAWFDGEERYGDEAAVLADAVGAACEGDRVGRRGLQKPSRSSNGALSERLRRRTGTVSSLILRSARSRLKSARR
ncbi:MAG: alginate export family protein [Gammaproteobacteria bacterium]|nr:alginate export family protein [Gammaproteobacteria bacterium]